MTATATQTNVVALSIVTNVDSKLTQVVTTCVPDGGQGWLDLFNLPPFDEEPGLDVQYPFSHVIMQINRDMLDDIHALWGMAWFDADGVVHTAGANPAYAERAKRNLLIHVNMQDGMLQVGDPEPQSTKTLFIADTPDDGTVMQAKHKALKELPWLLAFYGIEPEDTNWAFGVTTPEGVHLVLSGDIDRGVGVIAQLNHRRDRHKS